jgi:hypothetical protein
MSESQPETTASTSPLIFLSYSREDKKWEEQLRVFLKSAEQSERVVVWYYGLINTGEPFDEKINEAIERAKVAVLLISPDYLASEWLLNVEVPRLLERQQRGELLIVSILLRPCDWMEVDWLRQIVMLPYGGTPIAEHDETTQHELLNEAARYIIKVAAELEVTPHPSRILEASPPDPPENIDAQPPPVTESKASADGWTVDSLSEFDLSGEAQAILHRARVLATFTKETPKVTTSCLMFGMAEGGRRDSKLFKTPQFLWQELNKDGGKLYRSEFARSFPNAIYDSTDGAIDFDSITEEESLISDTVLNVFRLASDISRRTFKQPAARSSKRKTSKAPVGKPLPPGHIGARHLLAALLLYKLEDVRTDALEDLWMLVDDLMGLRKTFLDFIIISQIPGDDDKAWSRILLAGEEVPAPQLEESLEALPDTDVGFRAPLAGFLADSWTGRDLLDITPDVNALAALVAAWTIEPPLSIGLFGDWGSGKSHFMRQMKARVEKLSRKARDSGKPQNQISYYKNIVQIEFNAWHYIEGNLWASLVEHIFEHLKLSDNEEVRLVDERRGALMDKLGVTKEIQERAKERAKKAKERAENASNLHQAKTNNLSQLREGLKTSVLEQLTQPIKFSTEQEKFLGQLGVSSSTLTSAVEVHRQYLEIKSLWGRVTSQVYIFKNDPRRLRKLLIPLTLVVVPPIIGFALALLNQLLNKGSFSGIRVLIGTALTFILTFLVSAKPYWNQFQQGLKVLEAKNKGLDDERQCRIAALKDEIEVITKEIVNAESEAEEITRQVKELEQKIQNTTAGQILAEFIEDRAACSDYRRHLGVLALIRRDFEKLAALFNEQREEERKGNGVADHKTINRIILYIDDLDRCPPERVVQVLQAIHLLLAFPLFVVVVGVDARWVTRSLQESYEWLRAADDEEGQDEKDEKMIPGKNQGATPHDYLEKIFQIPFWLKPMGDAASKKFILGLTENIPLAHTQEKQNGDTGAQAKGMLKLNEAKAGPARTVGPNTEREKSDVAQPVSTQAAPSPDDVSPNEINRAFEQVMNGKAHGHEAAVSVVNNQDAKPSGQAVEGAPDAADTSVDTEKADEKAQAEKAIEKKAGEDEDAIDLETQNLTIEEGEVSYMQELTPLIGRSPRAVKRFLNCYRLIKVGVRPAQLPGFIGAGGQSGNYKAVMILLGIITGAPSVSLYFIEELEKLSKAEKKGTIHTFLAQLQKNLEVSQQPDWTRVQEFLANHVKRTEATEMLEKLIAVMPSVSRYSFRVARVEAARQKKPQTRQPLSQAKSQNVKTKAHAEKA